MHWMAVFTTLCTFVLLCSGGLVTSHGVGLAVPDWPNTFGYNMFLFPISRWVDGVFYEHSHRLIASGVGLLTVILSVWLLIGDSRKWIKLLGICAVVAVVIQGVLGGLRVTLLQDELGIFHGMLAQAFFVLLGILSVATSRSFLEGRWTAAVNAGEWRRPLLWIAVLIFCQLGIGATMRHEHAGLSIPDFPTAYGGLLPNTTPQALEAINEVRAEAGDVPTTAFQIWLQMTHRLVALGIAVLVAVVTWRAFRRRDVPKFVRVWLGILSGMVVAQILLGAWSIWSNKAADVATGHMALGALMLFVSGRLAFRAFASNRMAEVADSSASAQGLTEAPV